MSNILDLIEYRRRRRQLEDIDIAIAEGYQRVAEELERELTGSDAVADARRIARSADPLAALFMPDGAA